jgi:hypothetical protein
MTGFFISKLPSGHAVKDNTKAAAIASLRGEDIVKATPANTVPLLRQQCAAIVRLRRDVCTADNLEKLALADRAYLLKLCGLLCGGTVPARLILGAFSTTSSYIPEMVAPLRAAAAVVRRRAVTLHPAEGSSSGSSAAAGGGGAGAGGGSLPATLLSSAAASALNLLGRVDLIRLPDEAGVPFDAGDNVSILRDKCGVAAWAAEQLRAPADVRAISAPDPSRVMDALGVSSAWKSEPQDRALEGILRGCRDSSWARDPAPAHGIVCPQRSAIFSAVVTP